MTGHEANLVIERLLKRTIGVPGRALAVVGLLVVVVGLLTVLASG